MTTFFAIAAPVLLMAVLFAIVAPVRWRMPRPRRIWAIATALAICLLSIGAYAQQPVSPFGLGPLPNSGLVVSHYNSAASTNSTLVFATTSQQSISSIFGFNAINTNSVTAYIKFYDKATAPTCGTDVPKMTYQLSQNVPVTKGFLIGIPFKLGIGFCITALVADTDTTAATTGISVDIAHK